MKRQPCALVMAGGTGGHVFPAQATAAALDRLGAPIAFLTDGRGAAFEVAGSTVALVPIVILFFMFQRYFIESIAMTGVKG